MKLLNLMAVTGLVLASVGATSATAQPGDRHGDRHGSYRHDGRGYGDRHRQHCRTEYRHHRRVRICR